LFRRGDVVGGGEVGRRWQKMGTDDTGLLTKWGMLDYRSQHHNGYFVHHKRPLGRWANCWYAPAGQLFRPSSHFVMAGMLCLSRRQANCIDLCLISYLGNGALSTYLSHYYYGGLTVCNAQAGIIVTFVSFLTEKMPHYVRELTGGTVLYCREQYSPNGM
jgi:hypothetical protein